MLLTRCGRQLVMQAPAEFASRVAPAVEVSASLSRRDALTSRNNDVMLLLTSSTDDCIVCVVTSQRRHYNISHKTPKCSGLVSRVLPNGSAMFYVKPCRERTTLIRWRHRGHNHDKKKQAAGDAWQASLHQAQLLYMATFLQVCTRDVTSSAIRINYTAQSTRQLFDAETTYV